jgi:hypothetical protein
VRRCPVNGSDERAVREIGARRGHGQNVSPGGGGGITSSSR